MSDDDESVKVKPFDFTDDSDSVGRASAEQDVSLDEMLSLACRQGKLDIVELLLQSGAKVNHRNKAGNTPLLEACSQGHVSVASYLLENGADIDSPTETTLDSALTWACTLGNVRIVDLLLSKKANVEHRTKDGCTALMFACLAGHVDVAEKLLDHSAEINVESDSNKDSPLTFACWKGHESVVELLLERSADIEHRTKEGFSPLMFAALGGHTEVASKLLNRKALVNIPSGSNNDIPLTSACWKGHHNVVKLLLNHTSNIEHRTKDGCTPLMLAAREGHFCVAKLLLEHGAQVNIPSGSENNIPLTLACWKGHTKVVELLLEHQSNIEHRNKAGCTPLMLAAREGHLETTMLLLDKNALVNVPSGGNDDTPLTLACWKGHYKVVELLLQCQSNVDHQTKTGCTPLMEATREGHRKVAEILLNHVADVELPDNYGQSPLFMACWKGHRNVAELLLQRNANRDSRTRTGITPLFQACRENHVEIVDLLISYGASINSPFPNSRENPMTLAAEKGHIELVRLLMEKCANHDCHTKKGCTPFFLACKEGHKEISEELKKYGSEIEAPDCRGNTPIMASFKNGHVVVVEWLIKQIYHLPSDEMCHKILMSSVDEKDREVIMQKRSKCLAIIQEAKKSREQQALRNAQILVQELDEEKCREEKKKKKQAAKRRDKRKRKKPSVRENEADNNQTMGATHPLENRFEDSNNDTNCHDDDDDYSNEKEQGSSEPDFIDDNEEEECRDKSLPQENREDPEEDLQDDEWDTDNRVSNSPIVTDVNSIDCSSSVASDTCNDPTTLSQTVSHDYHDEWQGVDSKDFISSSRQDKRTRRSFDHSDDIGSRNNTNDSSSMYRGDSPAKYGRERNSSITNSSLQTNALVNKASTPSSTILPNADFQGHDWKDVLRTPKTLIVQLSVPNSFCGRVIGRGGTKINSITDESGAQITVNKPEPQTPNDRLITIKGTPACVDNAKRLVTEALNSPSIFQQPIRPSLTLGGFIDPKTTLTLSTSQVSSSASTAIKQRSSLPVGVKSSGESTSSLDWPRSVGASTRAQNTTKTSTASTRTLPNRTSVSLLSAGNTQNDASCKLTYSSYSNVITGQSKQESDLVNQAHREQNDTVFAWGNRPLTSAGEISGPTPPLRPAVSVAVCTQSEETSVSQLSSRSPDAIYTSSRHHKEPYRSIKPDNEEKDPIPLVNDLIPQKQSASEKSSNVVVSHSGNIQNRPGKNDASSVAVGSSSQSLPAAQRQQLTGISSFGAIGDSRMHSRTKELAPTKSAPPDAGNEQRNDFSYFSPWSVQTSDVKKKPSQSAPSALKPKRSEEGPLQSFTSLVQSSLYSRDIPPYPWNPGSSERDERSRSISWAGNSSSMSSGDDGDGNPSNKRDGPNLPGARSASTETLQDRGPGSTVAWGPPLASITKDNSEESIEEQVFNEVASPWQTKPNEAQPNPSNEAWDRSSSPTSSVSSSRQELTNILDNESSSNHLGTANAWSRTPSSDQGNAKQGPLSFQETSIDTRQWSNVQGRGAYSAPSSPAIQRIDNNDSNLTASSADPLRSSMDELATKNWLKSNKQHRQHHSDTPSWADNSKQQQQHHVNDERRSSAETKATQSRDLASPRINSDSVSGNTQSIALMNSNVSTVVTTTTTKTSWRPECFENVGTITDLLGRLSLGKYTDVFMEKQVDLPMLMRLEEIDLQTLGIPKGPRLKIMKASQMMRGNNNMSGIPPRIVTDSLRDQQQQQQHQQHLQQQQQHHQLPQMPIHPHQTKGQMNPATFAYIDPQFQVSPYTVAMTPNSSFGRPPPLQGQIYATDAFAYGSPATQHQQIPMPLGHNDFMPGTMRPPPPTLAGPPMGNNNPGTIGSHPMRYMYHETQPAYYYYTNPQGP